MLPTLQFSMAQRYLNDIKKSKSGDQKLSIAPVSLIQFLNAPLFAHRLQCWGSPSHSHWEISHQPDPRATIPFLSATPAVTLIYSKPSSQENQTEFEHIKTKLSTYTSKSYSQMQRTPNSKHYRLQIPARHSRCMQGLSQKGTAGRA